MERKKVYEILDDERDYQDSKKVNLGDKEKSVAEWILYMEYHLDIAKRLVYHLSQTNALAEIRKVTALGVVAMEVHGCPEREINKN